MLNSLLLIALIFFAPAVPFIIVIVIGMIRDSAYNKGSDEAWNAAIEAQRNGRTLI